MNAIHLLIVLLSMFCSTAVFSNSNPLMTTPKAELTDAIFPRTDSKYIELIYQMLKVIDLLFTKHDITYWIDGGTALGAVRHKGIIPWDDDADLVFHIEDQDRIVELSDEFATFGFSLRQEKLIRLYPSPTSNYPYIDLAGYTLCEDNIYHLNVKIRGEYYFKNFYWLPNEVEPLVKIPFGPLLLNAPNYMLRYLFTGYGEDCLLYAIYQMPHGGDRRPVINRKVRLVDFSPAK